MHVVVRRLGALGTEKPVRIDVRMQRWRIGHERVLERHQRQVLVLNAHQSRGRLRRFARFGGDSRDPVADHAHSVAGQSRPIEKSAAEPHVSNIGAGQDGMNSGEVSGGTCIDREDACVRPIAPRVG